jgi:ABC-2 type transport system permease protein
VKNQSLVRKMNVPREMFPVASVLVTGYHMIPQYIILISACLLVGWHLDPTAVAAGVLGVSIIVTFSLAVGLAFSALNVLFRDFQNIASTISQMVMWTTPMIYPFDLIARRTDGNWLEQLYLANPVAEAVILGQRCFWSPTLDDDSYTPVFPDHLLLRGVCTLAACLVLVWLAQRLFSRLEGKFAEQMI